MSDTSEKSIVKKFNCLNLFKFLMAALPTIVFGIFTIIFSLQQDASARATREQDQRQADEINRRIIFKEYIDDMKELLLDEHFAKNMNRSLLQMRIQTLTVLRHLDPPRKYDLIRFLYENDLIRHDRSPTIDLAEADLSNLQFIQASGKSCSMNFLYLPGVYAENITFISCYLGNASFNRAVMTGATFNSCHLAGANFVGATLQRARFGDSYVLGVNFNNTNLIQSVFDSRIFQGVQLINADLYRSNLDDLALEPMKYGGVHPNVIFNTRYPNGSNSELLTENLMDSGEAEQIYQSHGIPTWYDVKVGTPIQIFNSDDILDKEKYNISQCCLFRINPKQTVINVVELSNYSRLIDLKQIMFNLSLCVGLIGGVQNHRMTITINFAQYEGGFDYSISFKKIIQNEEFFKLHSFIYEIPPLTKAFYIVFACDGGTEKNQYCVFDHVQLFMLSRDEILQR